MPGRRKNKGKGGRQGGITTASGEKVNNQEKYSLLDKLDQLSLTDNVVEDVTKEDAIRTEEMTVRTCEAISLAFGNERVHVVEECRKVIHDFLAVTELMEVDGVGVVMDHVHFMTLLKKLLTSQATALKLEGLYLINCLTTSSKIASHVEKVAGLIPILVNFLNTSVVNLCEETLKTLEKMFTKGYLVKEVISRPGFFPAMVRLAKKGSPLSLATNTILVMHAMSNQGPLQLSTDNVKSITSVFRYLMDIKDSKILGLSVSCIGTLSMIDNVFDSFLRGGLVLRVTSLLSNVAAKEVHPQVGVSIARFAETEEKALALLKVLRDTSYLKEYYRFWTNEFEKIRKFTKRLIHVMLDLHLHSPTNTKILTDMLNCGLAYSLVQSMKKNVPLEFRRSAASIIGRMCCDFTVGEKRVLVDAGVLPISAELLQSQSIDNITLTMVACILGNIVQSKPQYRDEIVSLGAFRSLVSLLSKNKNKLLVVKPIAAAIQMILSMNPKASFAVYRDSPLVAVLNELVDIYMPNFEAEESFSITIILILVEYSMHDLEAVELAMQSQIVHKILPLLSCEMQFVREAACTLLFTLVGNTTIEHLLSMLNRGVLNYLELLLEDRDKRFRQMAMKCLLCFLYAEVPFSNAHTTVVRQRLLPYIMEELDRRDPDTYEETYLTYSLCIHLFVLQDGIQDYGIQD